MCVHGAIFGTTSGCITYEAKDMYVMSAVNMRINGRHV